MTQVATPGTETQTLEVHPAAAEFPMLPQDELDELAADIKEQGLLEPIVLDKDGQVLDGRNRLAACEIAQVEPRFTTYEGSAETSYIVAKNINRRHLSQGQRAMILAKIRENREPDSHHDTEYNTIATIAKEHGVGKDRLSHANVVLQYAPDQVDMVVRGEETLDGAYAIARERKVNTETKAEKLEVLRHKYADLGIKIAEGNISSDEALAQMALQMTEEDQLAEEYEGRLRRARERLRQLLIGWIELSGLPEHPDRDAILQGMSAEERRRIESIEQMYRSLDDDHNS